MPLLALVAVVIGLPLFTFSGFGAGLTATPAPPAEGSSRARLAASTTQPLVVEGAGFLPRERVRVTAAGHAKRVRAGRRGAFVVSFPGLDACNGVTVVAQGSGGSLAQVQVSSIHCL